MTEVQIKVEIQDSNGSTQKRASLAVPEDITREELVSALTKKYPELGRDRLSVMVEWPEGKPATNKLVTDGALVVVKPRSSGVRFLEEHSV